MKPTLPMKYIKSAEKAKDGLGHEVADVLRASWVMVDYLTCRRGVSADEHAWAKGVLTKAFPVARDFNVVVVPDEPRKKGGQRGVPKP